MASRSDISAPLGLALLKGDTGISESHSQVHRCNSVHGKAERLVLLEHIPRMYDLVRDFFKNSFLFLKIICLLACLF